jgi:hypothetical protein
MVAMDFWDYSNRVNDEIAGGRRRDSLHVRWYDLHPSETDAVPDEYDILYEQPAEQPESVS